jgi:hypothetical protein
MDSPECSRGLGVEESEPLFDRWKKQKAFRRSANMAAMQAGRIFVRGNGSFWKSSSS